MLELDEHVELGKSATERWEERRKAATDDKTGKILKGFPGRKPGTRNKNPYVYPQRKVVDMSIDDGTSEASSMSDADLESIALGGVL